MDKSLQDALDADKQFDTKKSAADYLGIPVSTFKNRLDRALKYEDAEEEERPGSLKSDLDRVKGTGWLQLTDYKMPTEKDVMEKFGLDPNCWRVTRVVPNQWQGFFKKGNGANASAEKVTMCSMRIFVERIVSESVEVAVEAMAKRIKPLPRPPKRRPKKHKDPQLGVLGLYDAHIGALCWEGETDQSNDTAMAVVRCKKAIDDLCDDLIKNEVTKLMVPIGNDFMHFDNERGETSSGRVMVDFDSRYANVVVACHDVLSHLADRCLEVCDDVEFILVAGNHDKITSLHMAHWMKQRYVNDERVSVDTSMHARKYRLWEGTLLGFAHGDRLNLKECYRHMAEEAREQWSSATCREFHVGDKHNRKDIDLTTTESMGRVTIRQNPSLAPRDLWTYLGGFDAPRCADVFRYGKFGFLGMSTTYAK